ncbi:MAG: diguanylate cyclase [Gemmatimonadota bacterium]|jgi:diguanylate cyclase (GGDEF)-like protein
MASSNNLLDIRERYWALLDISRTVTATLEPAELYRTIYEQASRVIDTTGFYIALYEASTDTATIVFYADRGEVERTALSYRGSDSIAIRERRPVIRELDRPEHEAILLLGPESDPETTCSLIAAPMLYGDSVLGVISAQSYEPGTYGPDDLELLAAIANQAAVALHNARFIDTSERRRREAERLEQIARALTASLDLPEVLKRIVDATRALAEADGAGVWLFRDDDEAELAISAGTGALRTGMSISVPGDIRDRALEERRPLIFDVRRPDPVFERVRGQLPAESAIAVPLINEGRLVGALSIHHEKARDYPPEDVEMLERLAYQAAIAIANARLHEQILTLSLTDPLTDLPNRRHMEIFLQKEFAAAQRGRPLSIVMFDLDNFKRYNDQAGHQAGDEALRAFASILAEQTRAMNFAARYGGDEFICILSGTGRDGARAHVGRVLHGVERDSVLADIGVSAGIATYHDGMTDVTDLMRAADRQLYRDKRRHGA